MLDPRIKIIYYTILGIEFAFSTKTIIGRVSMDEYIYCFLNIMLLVGLIFIGHFLWSYRYRFMRAWWRMAVWERKALMSGLFMLVVLSGIQHTNMQAGLFSQIAHELLHLLASALFVLGALAFLQKGHKLFENGETLEQDS